jgi:hypothetical protein
MKLRTKILLSLSVIVLLIIASLCGGILYLYYKPAAVKPFIEKTISGSTGTSFTIQTLSYSLKPFQVRANGILIQSGEGPGGFSLTISDLIADLALKGPFGQKTLILTNLKVNGFSFLLSEGADLPKFGLKEKGSGIISRILNDAIGLFLLKDIKFQAAEMRGGEITANWKGQMIEVRDMEGSLHDEGPIEIICSANMKIPSADMELAAHRLLITTDSTIDFDDPVIKGTISASEATFLSPKATIQDMDIKAKLTYSNNQKSLTSEPLDLLLKDPILKLGQDEFSPSNLSLNIEGIINLDERRMDARRLKIVVDDALRLNGEAAAHLGPKKDVRLKILDGRILPLRLLALLPERLKEKWPPITLSNPIRIAGQIDGQNESDKWNWHSDLVAELKQNPFAYETANLRFKSRLTGNIEAKGTLPDLNLFIEMKGNKTLFSHPMIKPTPFAWDLSMTGKHPLYRIRSLKADIPEVTTTLGEKEIPIERIRLLIRDGKLRSDKRFLSMPNIRLQTALLNDIGASLEVDGKRVALKLEGDDARIIEAAHSLNLMPKGWQIKGRDSIRASLNVNEKGDMSFGSKFGFTSFDFQNEDGSAIGEKITIIGDINGTLDPTHSVVATHSALRVTGGEILFDQFYFDLNKNTFSSSAKGNYAFDKKSLQLSNLKIDVKDLITLQAKGEYIHKKETPDIQLSIDIPKTPLEPVFQHFVVEPFKTQKPFLPSLELGGAFSASLAFKSNGPDRRVMGHYLLHEGKLVSKKNGISFEDIDLDLPFWYQTQTSKAETNDLNGQLSIQSMALPLLPEQSLKIPLAAGANRLSVRSPTILKAHTGEIQLGPFTFSNLFSTSPNIETSLTLSAVELDPFLSEIWARSIQGTLNGTLAPIHFEKKNLSSKGELRVSAFGGDIVLSDIGASGLFSSSPLFRLNGQINDLHLDLLTRETSFGRIEGILKGHILDLEVAHKQPQKFDLLLETVKKRGINQRISIMAVDNIARIGGGQSPFMGFAGVITSFFKEFPYKKIGVAATLDNDIFRIRGTIKEDGKEFIVKRGGLSGVNVINQNPDNRIRFQDMVKRVKRITAGKGGPVIE